MRRIFGCTEGLENKLKADAEFAADEIVERATNKRYTSSRIRRIITSNMLGLYADDAKKYIAEGTYIKPLAVRESRKDVTKQLHFNPAYRDTFELQRGVK